MAAQNRANMTEIERREHLIQRTFYNDSVLRPAEAMKKAGVSAEKIKAFQAEARKEYRETKKRHLAANNGAKVDANGKSAIIATVEELREKLKGKELQVKKSGSDIRSFFKGG